VRSFKISLSRVSVRCKYKVSKYGSEAPLGESVPHVRVTDRGGCRSRGSPTRSRVGAFSAPSGNLSWLRLGVLHEGDSARHRGDSDPPGATRGADSAHAGPTRSAEWEHGRPTRGGESGDSVRRGARAGGPAGRVPPTHPLARRREWERATTACAATTSGAPSYRHQRVDSKQQPVSILITPGVDRYSCW